MDDLIDFGEGANTGTGDTIRVAFEKLQTLLVDTRARLATLEGGVVVPPDPDPSYVPSLKFNDARNSAYAGAL